MYYCLVKAPAVVKSPTTVSSTPAVVKSPTAATKPAIVVKEDPELLKKRHERFGLPVKVDSPTETSVQQPAVKKQKAEGDKPVLILSKEEEEKIQKRKERFGADSSVPQTPK